MKRKNLILKMTVAVALMWPCLLSGQTGLKVAPFFDGRYNESRDVVTVVAKGKALQPYGMSLYRSLTFSKRLPEMADIENAVTTDGKAAVDKETGKMGGKLIYAFYSLPPVKGQKKEMRYLFYRQNDEKTYLVYMEGQTTLERLKKMFNK